MVLRVRDVEVASRVERDTPGIAEAAGFGAAAAEDFDGAVIAIENLDAAVAELADVLPTVPIDANVVRIAEFAQAFARLAVDAEQFAVARKNLDPVIAGIGDIHSVLA